MANANDAANLAENYADLAAATASRLKPGTWESVQAMATLSIAQSLVAQRGANQ